MAQEISRVEETEQEEDTSLVISIGDPEHSTYLDLVDTKPRSTTAHVLVGATVGVLAGVAGLALAKSGKLPFTIPGTNPADQQKLAGAFVAATTALGAIIPALHSRKHNAWAKKVLAETKEAQAEEMAR